MADIGVVVPAGTAASSTAARGTAAPSTAARGTAAQSAAALVRSIGLVGLVRPATVSAATRVTSPSLLDTAPVAFPAPSDRASGATRLRVMPRSGVAAGTNAGSIAGGLGAPDRTLPVISELRPLLPGGGLRRGSTVAASGATSLVIGLLAAASQAGSWCAIVGLPTLGAAAAAEAGVVLDRLALVPYPGPEWSTVVAALLDGIDVVVTAPPGPVAASLTGRLAARARQRGSVLIGCGRWPGADISIASTGSDWEGLDNGRGRLRRRRLTLVARGRGAASQPREITVWMPAYAPMHEDWSVDRWRERNRAERTLTLVPSPDPRTDGPAEPFVPEVAPRRAAVS